MSEITINRVTNCNIYLDGESFLGKAEEINLPMINFKMVEHKALGMVGTLEFFAGIEKMEAKIKWNSYYAKAMKKFANPFKNISLQCRASLETYDNGGRTGQVPMVVFMKVAPKGFPGGNLKQHDNAELESNLTCYYFKQEINGEVIVEFDPMANIFKVDGVDLLAQYKANIGG